jgi:hypothetical protein
VSGRTEHYERAFEGMDVPEDLRAIAERICSAYGIKGICDPPYIANIVAKALGRGDGQSSFTPADRGASTTDRDCPRIFQHRHGRFCDSCLGWQS